MAEDPTTIAIEKCLALVESDDELSSEIKEAIKQDLDATPFRGFTHLEISMVDARGGN